MRLPTVTIVGFIILNLGFWPVFLALGRRGALGSSLESMKKAWAAFGAPASGLETVALWGGPALIFLGAALCLSGVFLTDVKAKRICRAACVAQGFEDGMMRGDPHAERPGETPRACWCFNGRGAQRTWAAQAATLPTDSP